MKRESRRKEKIKGCFLVNTDIYSITPSSCCQNIVIALTLIRSQNKSPIALVIHLRSKLQRENLT
ncbi:hypothetical protein BY458DRAFT_500635 [Sporodiniella umbellata]|nr:hypothetical protein BY458DRAFT_500635 [Sporodiniella umbellata]